MNFTTFRSLLVLWLPIKVTYCYWGNRIPVINVSQEKLRLQENISNSSQFFMDFEIYLHIYWMPWGLFSLLELVLLIEGFNFRETSFFLILSILNKIWRPFRNIVNWKMLLGFSLIRIYIYIYTYIYTSTLKSLKSRDIIQWRQRNNLAKNQTRLRTHHLLPGLLDDYQIWHGYIQYVPSCNCGFYNFRIISRTKPGGQKRNKNFVFGTLSTYMSPIIQIQAKSFASVLEYL